MSVDKRELHELVEQLTESDWTTVYDFMQFLLERNGRGLTWEEIEKLQPDNEPLSEEVLRQLHSADEYITGREAKHEFGLQVDLP